MKYVLDTHTFVWWHIAPERLSRAAFHAIENSERYEAILLSSMSVVEIGMLWRKGKLAFTTGLDGWLNEALRVPKLRVVDVSVPIAAAACQLPGDFQPDPADRIIVATARLHNATIVTMDRAIQAYAHVPTLW